MGKRASPEEAIQRNCVDFLARFVPVPPDGPAWTAVNPISAKSKAAAGISRAMGLRAGVHDLVLCWRGRFIGIEIKAPKGRVTPEQKRWHGEVEAALGESYVIYDVGELAYLLRQWGVVLKGRVAA